MSRFSIIQLLLFLFSYTLLAQQSYTIRGTVVDETRKPTPNVNIFLSQSKRGTITNRNGEFSLKINKDEDTLNVSHIGYETFSRKITQGTEKLQIQLKPLPYQLGEVVITNVSAKELLQSAIRKAPDNYEQTPFLTKVYYRLTGSEEDTLLYLEETAFNIIKSYKSSFKDEYFLIKNRNFKFVPNKSRWHGIGGYDFVNQASQIFDNSFWRNHEISYLPSTTFDGRTVYVLSVSSLKRNGKFEGQIYIDMDDLAFIRFDLTKGDIGNANTQYKKIDGKYYLMNGSSVRINERDGKIRPGEANLITTDIIHIFSKEDIEGVPVNMDDFLQEYATQQEDTLFWKEHNALLPDSAIREAMLMYEQKQLSIKDSLDHIANLKRPYVPNVSLMLSSDWTKDFSSLNYNSVSISHLVDYYLYKKTNNIPFVPFLASYAYYALSFPFESALVEKTLLNINGLNPKMNPSLFNGYQDSYIYGIHQDAFTEFKENNYLDFMRLHTIRNDGHYTKALLMEEELAKVDLSNRNNRFDLIRYYSALLLHRALNLHDPFVKDVKNLDYKEEKQPMMIDRSKSWVHSLFKPEANYQRHVKQDDLTGEEQRYLKRSAWFSMLNLVSPQMIGIGKFRINEHFDFTFSTDYLRIPFGEMFGQNIWFMYNDNQLHGLFLKQYKTYEKTMLGIGYKHYDFKLFRNMYVNSTLDIWQQPAELQFKDPSAKIGFHVGQLYELQLIPDKYKDWNNLSVFIGYDYKTRGYMPQDYFMSKKIDVKAGFKWYF